jgi:hypothetical protein
MSERCTIISNRLIIFPPIAICLVNTYGRNGMGLEAVELYRRMPPDLRNSVSDVCVLTACSHSGLVEQAQSIFDQISNKSEHIVTTMVSATSLMMFANDVCLDRSPD